VLIAITLGLGVVVLLSGTVVESRWTGAMQPCTRAVDNDNSTFQDGQASMRWIPPRVHCTFARIAGHPRETTDEFALFGVALSGLGVALLLVLAFWMWVIARIARSARKRQEKRVA
jgi:hypothetical protein